VSAKVSRLEVPYSEHSSFSELRRFVRFLGLGSASSVIPTVNMGNAAYREGMKRHFKEWVEGGSGTAKRTRDIGTCFVKGPRTS
jgi:hypothetical protein